MAVNFAYEVSPFILSGFFTCRKSLRHGTYGFAFPPKEGVLHMFIAVKNPSSSTGFEPANLGYNGKHANH
jgi:hypothetical protein